MIGRQEARSLAGLDRISPDPASRYAVSRLFLHLALEAAPPPHPNVGARRFRPALSQRQQLLWLVLRARSSPHATIRARRSRVSDLSFSGKLPAASVLSASTSRGDSRRSRCYGLSEPVVPLVVRIQRDKEAGGPVRRTQDLHDPRRQHLGFGVQEPFPVQSHLVDNLVFRLQKDTIPCTILYVRNEGSPFRPADRPTAETALDLFYSTRTDPRARPGQGTGSALLSLGGELRL